MFARHRQQVTLNCGFDQAMAGALAAAQQVYDGASYDRNQRVVHGSKGFSLSSYGDTLLISGVTSDGANTVLEVYSKPVWGFMDFGHNKRLVQKVIALMQATQSNQVDLREPVLTLDADPLELAAAPIVLGH